MNERPWWIAVVRLSEGFRGALGELAAELEAGLVEWNPAAGDAPPAGAGAVVILAGGAEPDALDLLRELPASPAARFVVGAAADHRIAVETVRRGARDYFALPGDTALLRRALEGEQRRFRARADARTFADGERRASGFDAIVGRSATLHVAIEHAKRVAAHRDVTVMIGGETGTGKELLARALHYDSPRAAEPFVEINCAAIPVNLLESELFGHEAGSFTGAIATKAGLFEMANGGTLFLDEVGALPLELQPKLLRALETRQIRRVGGHQQRQVDVRVVAATHLDLARAVSRGEFREDLFYRLNVVHIVLPPLRERADDVELLAETFLQRLATSYGLPIPPLTSEVRSLLRTHPWPGNVRELRNAVERALVLSPAGTLRADEFPPAEEAAVSGGGPIPFPAPLATVIRAAVKAMLQLTEGNKSEAARRLEISRPRLQRLLDGKNTD